MMEFTEAVSVCFSKYADFSGRARRAEYWWWVLFNFGIAIVLMILDVAILGIESAGWGPLGTLGFLGLLFPNLAVNARRLHDTNRSGWWQLWSIPAVLIIAILTAASNVLGAIGGVAFLVFAVVYFIWLVTQGTKGSNQYGNDPLAEVDAVTADE